MGAPVSSPAPGRSAGILPAIPDPRVLFERLQPIRPPSGSRPDTSGRPNSRDRHNLRRSG